jgi:glycosyltransferase involved in cell wall biosynthesis
MIGKTNNKKTNELTVIIPFLNEGVEVENTLRSIRDTSGYSVDILIINDCSSDDFDYEKIALQFGAFYHYNDERLGVAASRDLGVELSQTPYFLLLDAHMRFYRGGWVDRIVNELKINEQLLWSWLKSDEMLYLCRKKDET